MSFSFLFFFRLFFAAIFSFSSISLFAQAKGTNPSRALELKKAYSEYEVVNESFNSHYEFVQEDEGVVVYHTNELNAITLESNVDYFRHIFYNDKIDVIKSAFSYSTKKGSVVSNEVCGNYEVDNIFYSDAKVCSFKLDITYAATEVNMSFRTKYKDPRYLTKIFFNDSDPSEKRHISVIVPDGIEVELIERNFEGQVIKKSVQKSNGSTFYIYEAQQLPEIKSEENSLGALHNYPHLLVLTKTYQTQGNTVNLLSSVDDLYEWYAHLINSVDTDHSVFAKKVKELIADEQSDEGKIEAIYYWVQENIKYIAFEDGIAGFKPESASNVFTKKYGDCKGMAMLTREMLREAGFVSRLAWIGTNRIPYTYDIPSLAVDNHMICTVVVEGKQFILDPTERFIGLGQHAERIQGKEILIEDGKDYIRQTVPIEAPERNYQLREEELEYSEGRLIGSGSMQIEGELKNNIIYFFNTLDPKEQVSFLSRMAVSDRTNDDEVLIQELSSLNRKESMVLKYSYVLQNKSTEFGDDIYIDLDWEDKLADLEIDLEKRYADYYFGRKISDKVIKKISIPEGYRVSHLPKTIELRLKNTTVKVEFRRASNTIIYTNEIIINNGKIMKVDFAEWNGLVESLREIYDDQIVLTKQQS